MDTIRRAQADAARAIEESMRPILGSAGQEFLHEQIQGSVAEADPEAKTATGTERPRRTSDDDEDFYGGPLLR